MNGFIKQHWSAILGVIFAGSLSVVVVGCQPVTNSPFAPGVKIDGQTLQNEVAATQTSLDAEASNLSAAVKNYEENQTNKLMVFKQQLENDHDTFVQQHEKDLQAYNVKVAEINAKINNAISDLEKKEKIKDSIVDVVGGLAKSAISGTFDPVGAAGTILTSILGGLAAGATVDSMRKTGVINKLSAKNGGTS